MRNAETKDHSAGFTGMIACHAVPASIIKTLSPGDWSRPDHSSFIIEHSLRLIWVEASLDMHIDTELPQLGGPTVTIGTTY